MITKEHASLDEGMQLACKDVLLALKIENVT
jgi:hypothetical protein